jgi:NAD(P)-dependent dehydrogenase (short-subunit alcohol dehydrogenase family)
MSGSPLVVVVAGASRGVGRGVALALGEAGARVVVTGRSSVGGARTESRSETIEDTARAVNEAGGNGYPFQCDHTNERDVDHLVSWTLRRFGRIDGAISCVWGGNEGFDGEHYADGSAWGAPFWRRPAAPLGRFMETGLFAGLLLARAVAPAMVSAKRGLLGFVTFDAGGAYLGDIHYDLAKAAISRLAFACAEELRPHGVTALALSPGHVRTERVIEAGMADDAGESPLYAGRAFAALLADADVARHAGKTLHAADLARLYGFTDEDGSQPGRFSLD